MSRYSPLSPYVFILCVELLGNAIRNYDQIKGIHFYAQNAKQGNTHMMVLLFWIAQITHYGNVLVYQTPLLLFPV